MQSSSSLAAYAPAPSHSLESIDTGTAMLLESGQIVVPPLPWVAATLLHDTHALNPGVQLLGELATDDTLASAVLRICNSPTYQPRTPVVSLQQASSRLGLSALSEIALAASLQSSVFALHGFENELRAFWRGALAAALFAKDLGRSCGVPDAETFSCGLLHEIGFPLALQAACAWADANGYAPRATGVRDVVLAASRRLTPLAGACVVEAWALEAPLAPAIHSHHPAFRVTDSPHSTIAHMATQMAASLYRREPLWARPAADPTDHAACALPRLGDSVRVWVDSLTV